MGLINLLPACQNVLKKIFFGGGSINPPASGCTCNIKRLSDSALRENVHCDFYFQAGISGSLMSQISRITTVSESAQFSRLISLLSDSSEDNATRILLSSHASRLPASCQRCYERNKMQIVMLAQALQMWGWGERRNDWWRSLWVSLFINVVSYCTYTILLFDELQVDAGNHWQFPVKTAERVFFKVWAIRDVQ